MSLESKSLWPLVDYHVDSKRHINVFCFNSVMIYTFVILKDNC